MYFINFFFIVLHCYIIILQVCFRISTDLSNWFWDDTLLSQSSVDKSAELNITNNNKIQLLRKIFSKHGSSFVNELHSDQLLTFCVDELRSIVDCVSFSLMFCVFFLILNILFFID